MQRRRRKLGARITCASCGHENVVPLGDARKVLYIALCAGGVLLACPCIGVVAAIALTGFTGPNKTRVRQSECTTNLKSWFLMQRTHQPGYALSVDAVGFVPERGNRYAYFAGPGPLEDRGLMEAQHGTDAVGYGVDTALRTDAEPVTFEQLPPEVAGLVGLRGSQCPMGPDCSITLACAGNIDGDGTLDVWTISTANRIGPDGEQYPAGEPMPHINDFKH